MASRDINDLDTATHGLAIEFLLRCAAAQLDVIIDQTYRTNAEQDIDYAQGRTTPGNIITDAKGGESPHNCLDENGKPAARAFDIAILDETHNPITGEILSKKLDWNGGDFKWRMAHEIGQDLGLVLGLAWGDGPHFELADWRNV